MDTETLKKSSLINAPFANMAYGCLGSEKRIFFLVSMDERKTWVNTYVENSHHFRFVFYRDIEKLEQFTKSKKEDKSFRKCKCESVDEAINKINAYIKDIKEA